MNVAEFTTNCDYSKIQVIICVGEVKLCLFNCFVLLLAIAFVLLSIPLCSLAAKVETKNNSALFLEEVDETLFVGSYRKVNHSSFPFLSVI